MIILRFILKVFEKTILNYDVVMHELSRENGSWSLLFMPDLDWMSICMEKKND
jgi:hypothetical protein